MPNSRLHDLPRIGLEVFVENPQSRQPEEAHCRHVAADSNLEKGCSPLEEEEEVVVIRRYISCQK